MTYSSVAWHSDKRLPDLPAPANTVGVIGWMRANLFSSLLNTVLTLVSVIFLLWLLLGVLNWSLINAIWDASSAGECRERMAGSGHGGACWSVVIVRFQQLIYGFYPDALKWRPSLAFLGLIVFIAPVLFDLHNRTRVIFNAVIAVLAILFWVLAGGGVFYFVSVLILLALVWLPQPKLLVYSAVYPVLVYWLIWGGSVWGIGLFLTGILACSMLYFLLIPLLRTMLGEGPGGLFTALFSLLILIAFLLYAIGPLESGLTSLTGYIGLEAVESAKLGGFTLTVLLGITGIIGSLPLGILLALGRQSSMLFIKAVCVGFIEMIRGVPLITLLFVASTLLNYFLPKGTTFDIILRVVIMVTLFASAYMAEVIRGGLAALPRGQYEAADALGLDYNKAMRLIIMPQALKISIPGIVNTFIGLFKDTTLVSIIGLLDPLGLVQSIQADITWSGTAEEIYVFIALVFFVFCFGMSRYSMHLEKKLQTGHH